MTTTVGATTIVVKNELSSFVKRNEDELLELEGMSPLGTRLDKLRKKIGWSWRQLSRECGLNEKHLATAKDRGNMTVETALAVRRRTRVNLNWLLAGEETMGIHLTADEQAESIERRTSRKPPSEPPSKPSSR